MATPLVSGSIALLLNKEKNLSPREIKEKLMSSCIDLETSSEEQGAGMLNLKILFEGDEKEKDRRNNLKDKKDFLDSELFETIIIVLIVIFLLDSRI